MPKSATEEPSGPEVKRLADLVQYQPGAVVSRTLVHTVSGTVTLFAFDAGEGLSEHTAPYEAPLYLLEGEAEIELGGKTHHLHEGEMLLLPAIQPHALKAIRPFKMLLIMIRG